MSTLVVFYSFEGNTKFIAEIVANQLHADLLELQTSKKYPTKGLQKYIWGGKSVVLGEQPDLTNPVKDLSAYDSILIGTPVWAGSFAPPVNTFLHQYGFSNKKVALFACHGGGGAQKCFEKMKEALPNNQFVGEMDFVDPLKHKKEAVSQKAIEWGRKLPLNDK